MKQIGNKDLFPTEIEACSFVLNEGLCTRNIILICFYRFLNDAPIRLCFRLVCESDASQTTNEPEYLPHTFFFS